MNNRSNIYFLIVCVLFFVGTVISGYLLWHHYALINGTAGFGSFCSLNKSIDCDVVNTSSYSEILGIPLAAFSLSYYAFAAICTFLASRSQYRKRELFFVLVPLSSFSVLSSVYTFGISFFVIKSVCLLCSTLQSINIITAGLLWAATFEFFTGRSFVKDFKAMNRRAFVPYGAALVVLFVFVHLFSAQWKESSIFDEGQFIAMFRLQPTQKIEQEDAPLLGDADHLKTPMSKPVQIIEFADFQCPGCGMGARHMHRLLKIYGDKIQVVFKNFPLDPSCNPHIQRNIHDMSCVAAKAAICAQAQGKFYEFYEALFSNQQSISRENIKKWAGDFKLDLGKFEECQASPQTTTRILHEVDEAKRLGVESTPTFFINGRKVEGAINEDRMRALLKEFGV